MAALVPNVVPVEQVVAEMGLWLECRWPVAEADVATVMAPLGWVLSDRAGYVVTGHEVNDPDALLLFEGEWLERFSYKVSDVVLRPTEGSAEVFRGLFDGVVAGMGQRFGAPVLSDEGRTAAWVRGVDSSVELSVTDRCVVVRVLSTSAMYVRRYEAAMESGVGLEEFTVPAGEVVELNFDGWRAEGELAEVRGRVSQEQWWEVRDNWSALIEAQSVEAGEQVGDIGGRATFEQEGLEVPASFGVSVPLSNRVDAVGLTPGPPPRLVVGEFYGMTGERGTTLVWTSSGANAEPGSFPYLADVMFADPRFAGLFAERPQVWAMLQQGGMGLSVEVVTTRSPTQSVRQVWTIPVECLDVVGMQMQIDAITGTGVQGWQQETGSGVVKGRKWFPWSR